MPADRVGRLLEMHRPSVGSAFGLETDKLRPVALDGGELRRVGAGEPFADLGERLVAAGKLDRSRKRTISDKVSKPRLRPPAERRKRS